MHTASVDWSPNLPDLPSETYLILSLSQQNILIFMNFTHFRESIPLSTLLSPTATCTKPEFKGGEKPQQLFSLFKMWINGCLFCLLKELESERCSSKLRASLELF